MQNYLIGIDLGGTTCKLAIVDEAGDVYKKWAVPTDCKDGGQRIVPEIIASIQETLVADGISVEQITAIGMGSPGSVDRRNGTVSGAFNLNWIEEQPIKDQFERAFAVPFHIENDANVAALGEKWRGSGNDQENVVFVTLGTGVGGGIICHDELVTGHHGCGGEIGHLYVTDNPIFKCTCGNSGCLEAVASATGMMRLAEESLKHTELDTALVGVMNGDATVTAKEIFDYAKAEDEFALQIVEAFCGYLGVACSHIANVLNPSKIIIGGGVSAAGDFLLENIQKVYMRHVFPKAREKDVLVLATLENDAGILGAAYLAKMNQAMIR